MELQGEILAGYKICDYLIVLQPHEELAKRIAETRKEFNANYKIEMKGAARPNLALVRFTQYELKEERITSKLSAISLGYPPFKVELNGYGSFPSHTIFISVTSKIPIQHLVKEIRSQSQQLLKLNEENKPYFILEPNFPLGNKLKPWQYEKGWLEYSHRSFTGKFIADAMLLLKRPYGTKPWQILRRFELQNLPVHTKQGDLF
ncbi:MAG: 2'-5' RNA ligase family protein [Chitinophagaceae bacterium]